MFQKFDIRERLWPRPAVARAGSDDHVSEDTRTATVEEGVRVPSSGPRGEHVPRLISPAWLRRSSLGLVWMSHCSSGS